MNENSENVSDEEDVVVPRKRGLGRGLNALFEDEEGVYPQVDDLDENTTGKKRDVLGIEVLTPGASQPRLDFDEYALTELADSIKEHGLLQPLLVRELVDKPGLYEIIAGERRWRAAQKAQLHEVPVIILELSDDAAMQIALIENLQREDLNPIEEAAGFVRLMDEFDYTQEKLAKALGKSRPYIANMMRLVSLPDSVQAYVRDGALSAGHARALITAKNSESLAKDIITRGLNVRQTEALVAEESGREKSQSVKSAKPAKDADTLALESEVSNLLGMKCSIDSADGKKGRVMIDFKSLDQLDDLLARLSNSGAAENTASSTRRLLG